MEDCGTSLIDACTDGNLAELASLFQWADEDGYENMANYADAAGETPLMNACRSGHVDIANELLQRGAYVNAILVDEDRDAWSPLMYAWYFGHTACVRLCAAVGADPELRNKAGARACDMTPCMNESDVGVLGDAFDAGAAEWASSDLCASLRGEYPRPLVKEKDYVSLLEMLEENRRAGIPDEEGTEEEEPDDDDELEKAEDEAAEEADLLAMQSGEGDGVSRPVSSVSNHSNAAAGDDDESKNGFEEGNDNDEVANGGTQEDRTGVDNNNTAEDAAKAEAEAAAAAAAAEAEAEAAATAAAEAEAAAAAAAATAAAEAEAAAAVATAEAEAEAERQRALLAEQEKMLDDGVGGNGDDGDDVDDDDLDASDDENRNDSNIGSGGGGGGGYSTALQKRERKQRKAVQQQVTKILALYRSSLNDFNQKVHPPIVSVCERLIDGVGDRGQALSLADMHVLKLNGDHNARSRDRLTDQALFPLFEVLGHGFPDSPFTTIDLSYNHIRNAGGKVLAIYLTQTMTLTSLNLEGNDIGPVGMDRIIQSLYGQETLLSLNLRHNPIGDKGITKLAQILAGNATLQSLDVGHTSFGCTSIVEFATSLSFSNATLTSLNLDSPVTHQQLQEESTVHLAKMLASNHTLRSLSLAHHRIGPVGCQWLGHYLTQNASVTSLDLRCNHISSDGITQLARVIGDRYCCLASLNLSANRLTDEGVEEMQHALSQNETLTHLDLSRCSLDDIGLTCLARVCNINRSLLSLKLAGNRFGRESARAWRALLCLEDDARTEDVDAVTAAAQSARGACSIRLADCDFLPLIAAGQENCNF